MHDRKSDEPGATSGRRARGELESGVLAALYGSDEPLSARQVRDRLPGDLAYTTVLTILSRLYDKGMLVRHRAGRGYAYAPARDEAAHTADRMRSLLEHGTDREAVLTRFLSELSEEDEQLLQRLLSENGGPQHEGPQHDGPQHGRSQHGGPQHGRPQHGGPQRGAPQQGGPRYTGRTDEGP